MKLFESLRGEGRTCIEWSGLAGHYQLRPYINLQLIAIQFWLWRHHMTRSPPVTLPASDGVLEVTCSRRGRGAPVLLLSSDLRAGGEPSGDWARPADTGEADGLHLTLAVTWRYKHYTSQPSGQCQPPQLLIPLWDMKADRRNDQTCLTNSPASDDDKMIINYFTWPSSVRCNSMICSQRSSFELSGGPTALGTYKYGHSPWRDQQLSL